MTIEEISEIAYTMNRTMVAQNGMGDEIEVVLPEWDETSQTYRDISVICTKAILMNDPKANPIEWHKDFIKGLFEAGWTYGRMRDEVNMTHPYMINYPELTIAQKQRLHLYGAVVNYYRDKLGEKMGICYKCREPIPEMMVTEDFEKEFYHSHCLSPLEIEYISNGSRLSNMPEGWKGRS